MAWNSEQRINFEDLIAKATRLLIEGDLKYDEVSRWKDADIRAAAELAVDMVPNYRIVQLGSPKPDIILQVESELRIMRGNARLKLSFA